MIRLAGWVLLTLSAMLAAAYFVTPDIMDRTTVLGFSVAAFALGDVVLLLTESREGR